MKRADFGVSQASRCKVSALPLLVVVFVFFKRCARGIVEQLHRAQAKGLKVGSTRTIRGAVLKVSALLALLVVVFFNCCARGIVEQRHRAQAKGLKVGATRAIRGAALLNSEPSEPECR